MFGGYLLDDAARLRLVDIAARGDQEKTWEWLDETIGRLEPDYTYPPFVLSVALDFMRGQTAPSTVPRELENACAASEIDVLFFHDGSELRTPLAFSELADEDLSAFFEQMIGERWETAPAAMREAIAYVNNGLTQSAQRDTWFVLLTSG